MFATAVRFLAKKAKGKRDKPANMNIGQEGHQWSGTMREIVKDNGPLSVASFWDHAQNTGIRSKRHMKIILRWMRGQNQVKLVCNHKGDKHSPTEKEFFYVYVTPRSERLAAKLSAEEESMPMPTDGSSSNAEDQSSHQTEQDRDFRSQ